jgi:predicted transcriptional regulator
MNYPATHDAPLVTSGNLSLPFHIITGQIVAAYVSHHAINPNDVPGLITQVYGAVSALGLPAVAVEPEVQQPAVPIKKSVTDDYIICLDDGAKLKSLRRHIGKLGYTPESYREKWGLPLDYPMVAKNYSEVRSRLAKENGLGTKR